MNRGPGQSRLARLVATTAVAAVCLGAAPAWANDPETADESGKADNTNTVDDAEDADVEVFEFGPKPTWSILLGPTGGGSFGSPGGGGFVGGEVSLARLNRAFWFGLYGDAVYDFGHGAATTTVGPGLGVGFFGLDGGLAARFDDGTDIGPTARFMVTTGFVALYGRWQFFPEVDEHVGQLGIVVKLPIWASSP